ncbi:M28 family peptidase [Ferruginibacter sp. HRS2-29]|uniref:M28 family peptidase n=1 Tax=Ferruginibacter sp. HRS2-29 TaxID=2487334 RepID=UPI0020CD9754|nr:M28 family peptidase [Ferruginibacter sp. HRS2-29]MCP9752699.1 M28 family peptidase [Ferruginibacter sp. HRS2-29]
MKGFLLAGALLTIANFSFAQNIDKLINAKEVERIERTLASDEMQGRKPFTPSIDKAADFIASEFKKSGLKYLNGLTSYRQPFTMQKATLISASGTLNNQAVLPENIIAVTGDSLLDINERSGYIQLVLDSGLNLVKAGYEAIQKNHPAVIFVGSSYAKNFLRLKRLKGETFETKAPVIFVLTDEAPKTFSFTVRHKITTSSLANVVGVLPGKTKPEEVVIFSGHYDHLGIGKPNAAGDSIYNGANDDAAGTTAVIMLANYFSKLKNNERTLIFVAFTAEESGGFGSQYFSQQIDADKAVAMFNIEMIGTESQWGKNSAYITGFDKSDFGKILQGNLAGSNFKFEPDPYPKQQLFYRSDNATLAALGVPAHTISTSKMDTEKFYHTQEDEVETLDMINMAEIIKAIAISSKGIISGKETPARVEKQ